MGGLWFKSARLTNDAFLLKVAWGIISDQSALWAKVLRAKYKIQYNCLDNLRCRGSKSNLMQGVYFVWMHLRDRAMWSMVDGESINFWRDDWLQGGLLIRDL